MKGQQDHQVSLSKVLQWVNSFLNQRAQSLSPVCCLSVQYFLVMRSLHSSASGASRLLRSCVCIVLDCAKLCLDKHQEIDPFTVAAKTCQEDSACSTSPLKMTSLALQYRYREWRLWSIMMLYSGESSLSIQLYSSKCRLLPIMGKCRLHTVPFPLGTAGNT